MNYLKSITKGMSIVERQQLVDRLDHFARILIRLNAKELKAFKEQNLDFYMDFLPWVLLIGAKINAPSLVNDVLEIDPEITSYDFVSLAGAISGLEEHVPQIVTPWANDFCAYPVHIAATLRNFDMCKRLLDLGFKSRPSCGQSLQNGFYAHSFDVAIGTKGDYRKDHIEGIKVLIDDDLNHRSLATFFPYLTEDDLRKDLSEAVVTKAVKGGDEGLRDYLVGLRDSGLVSNVQMGMILKNFPVGVIRTLNDEFFQDEVFLNSRRENVRLSTLCLESIVTHGDSMIDHGRHHNTFSESLSRQKTDPLEDITFRELLFKIHMNDSWLMEEVISKTAPGYLFEFAQECRERIQNGGIAPPREVMATIEAFELRHRIEASAACPQGQVVIKEKSRMRI